MRKGTSRRDEILAEAEAGASEGDITEDQICAAIDAAWQELRNTKCDDERTTKDMARFWGCSRRTAGRKLNAMVDAGLAEVRMEIVDGVNVNLYRLLNGEE